MGETEHFSALRTTNPRAAYTRRLHSSISCSRSAHYTGFRDQHSTEIALDIMTIHLRFARSNDRASAFSLVDLSVAFATSCHLPGLLQCHRRQTSSLILITVPISYRPLGPPILTITPLSPALTAPWLLPPCSRNLEITVRSHQTSSLLTSLCSPSVSALSFFPFSSCPT